jgi:hypothetical protein
MMRVLQFVLSKYGYLRCQVKRKRREAPRTGRGGRPSLLDLTGYGAVGGDGMGFNPRGQDFEPWEDVCDESKVAQAFKEYQRTYNLAPTGELDEETKMLMSTSRCGNKDSEKEGDTQTTADGGPATTTLATNTGGSIVISSPSSSGSSKTGSDSLHLASDSSSSSSSSSHQQRHHHHKKDDSQANRSDQVSSSQRLFKRATNRIRSDDSSHLLRVLKGEADRARRGSSESRHHRHLEEYIARLKQLDGTPLLEPWTPEEHARVRRSIIQVTAKGESEESVEAEPPVSGPGDPMDNMLDVLEQHHVGVEGEQTQSEAASTSEMFNKELIRWRLLNTGYSTRIPVEDQRATLDLAFRMWSEVIPLRFIEDVDSDISQVDIEVAFGRREYSPHHFTLISSFSICHFPLKKVIEYTPHHFVFFCCLCVCGGVTFIHLNVKSPLLHFVLFCPCYITYVFQNYFTLYEVPFG